MHFGTEDDVPNGPKILHRFREIINDCFLQSWDVVPPPSYVVQALKQGAKVQIPFRSTPDQPRSTSLRLSHAANQHRPPATPSIASAASLALTNPPTPQQAYLYSNKQFDPPSQPSPPPVSMLFENYPVTRCVIIAVSIAATS